MTTFEKQADDLVSEWIRRRDYYTDLGPLIDLIATALASASKAAPGCVREGTVDLPILGIEAGFEMDDGTLRPFKKYWLGTPRVAALQSAGVEGKG